MPGSRVHGSRLRSPGIEVPMTMLSVSLSGHRVECFRLVARTKKSFFPRQNLLAASSHKNHGVNFSSITTSQSDPPLWRRNHYVVQRRVGARTCLESAGGWSISPLHASASAARSPDVHRGSATRGRAPHPRRDERARRRPPVRSHGPREHRARDDGRGRNAPALHERVLQAPPRAIRRCLPPLWPPRDARAVSPLRAASRGESC